MNTTFAVEANFIPKRFPHEIINRRSGQRLIARINDWLLDYARHCGIFMKAKLDPHHNVYQHNETYSIEVVPVTSFQLAWAKPKPLDNTHASFVRAIDGIIETMRDHFGLVPSLVTRKKGSRTDLHWPVGGMHVHMGADLFGFSTEWYRQMERFHRDLVMDYANRPYVRWLFAHWMGEGSRVVIDRHRLEQRELHGVGTLTPQDIFSRSLFGASAIEPRFMTSAKASYLTFEFRFVGMVENAHQMCAAVRLLDAWMGYHQGRIEIGCPPLRFTLTPARWDEMVTPEGALSYCRAWVESLGLDWADYDADFFQRNLLMRINHGVME